jgi:hypothetical protein
MKIKAKIKAIKLRKKGASYSEIRKEISVSKSTLSFWLRDIELNNLAKQRIIKGLEFSRSVAAKVKKELRISVTREIMRNAQFEFKKLLETPLFLVGLSLYLAEGDKNIQERVKFANSDQNLIQLMMCWFREVCNIPENKFRIALHIHDLQSNKKVREFWSALTRVPLTQFQAVYVKKSTLRSRRNVLYNGTCSIVINSRSFFRRIMGWRMALMDYFLITK